MSNPQDTSFYSDDETATLPEPRFARPTILDINFQLQCLKAKAEYERYFKDTHCFDIIYLYLYPGTLCGSPVNHLVVDIDNVLKGYHALKFKCDDVELSMESRIIITDMLTAAHYKIRRTVARIDNFLES